MLQIGKLFYGDAFILFREKHYLNYLIKVCLYENGRGHPFLDVQMPRCSNT